MSAEQNKANKEKSKRGNKYSKDLYKKLRKCNNVYKIKRMSREKRFYYKLKTPEEEIVETINEMKKDGTYKSSSVDKIIDEYLKQNEDKLIRDDKKYYKCADITFMTEYKYFYKNKLSNIRIVIDTTTSSRGDRIKAKAQDAAVYDTFGFPYLYIIVLPNDSFFYKEAYKEPENEIKNCKKALYDHNFCNLYKEENVSLILQEKDLEAFLIYISKRKEKNIDTLINNFKKYHFKDMVEKRKKEKEDYKKALKEKILKML